MRRKLFSVPQELRAHLIKVNIHSWWKMKSTSNRLTVAFMSTCIYFSIKAKNEHNGEIINVSIEDRSKGELSSNNSCPLTVGCMCYQIQLDKGNQTLNRGNMIIICRCYISKFKHHLKNHVKQYRKQFCLIKYKHGDINILLNNQKM